MTSPTYITRSYRLSLIIRLPVLKRRSPPAFATGRSSNDPGPKTAATDGLSPVVATADGDSLATALATGDGVSLAWVALAGPAASGVLVPVVCPVVVVGNAALAEVVQGR